MVKERERMEGMLVATISEVEGVGPEGAGRPEVGSD